MRNFVIFLSFLFSGCLLQAQTTFTDHLRTDLSGKGKVTIEQSAVIENIVNKKKIKHSAVPAPQHKPAPTETATGKTEQPARPREAHEDLLDKFKSNTEKNQQPAKMQGYRIQVYAGPKSTGQSEARKIEQKCKKALPGISTYVRFIQPRWTCRIGDFQTRADANLFVEKLREAKVSSQITIVRCEIFKVY